MQLYTPAATATVAQNTTVNRLHGRKALLVRSPSPAECPPVSVVDPNQQRRPVAQPLKQLFFAQCCPYGVSPLDEEKSNKKQNKYRLTSWLRHETYYENNLE